MCFITSNHATNKEAFEKHIIIATNITWNTVEILICQCTPLRVHRGEPVPP